MPGKTFERLDKIIQIENSTYVIYGLSELGRFYKLIHVPGKGWQWEYILDSPTLVEEY